MLREGFAARQQRIGVSALRWTLGLLALALVLWAFARVAWREAGRWRSHESGIELTVLHWSGEGGPEEDAIVERSLAGFKAAHPGVRVRRINPGDAGSFYTKLQTMMAAGDPPDVFYVGSERIPSFGSLGLLEPLTPYLQRDERAHDPHALNLNDFYPQVVDAFRWDGHAMGSGELLGIPKDFTTVGFYYNKDLFRRAGVAFPSPDWTWDEFIAAARAIGALKDESGANLTGAEFVTWAAMVRAYLFTEGADVRGETFDDVALTDPRAMAALERLRAWRHDEANALTSGKSKIATGSAVFSTGRVGMAGPFGRWVVPEYASIRSFDWDFAPLPRGSERANIILTVAWAISSQSAHKDEAWKLVRWLTNADNQAEQARLGLAIPSNRAAAQSSSFLDASTKPANDQGFLAAIEHARVVDWPANPRYEAELGRNLDEGLKTATKTLPAAIAQFEEAWRTERESPLGRGDHPRMPWGAIAVAAAIAVAMGAVVLALVRRRTRLPADEAREERTGYLFASPWLIGFGVFMAFPIALSLLLSFTAWKGLGTIGEARWVGLGNYLQLLTTDSTFPTSVGVTLYFVLVAVPAGQLMALGAALLMNSRVRGIQAFRAAWYLPSVLAGVGVAVLWRWIFDSDSGLMNELLRPALSLLSDGLHTAGWLDAATTIRPPEWFGKDAKAFGAPAFAIMNMWFVGGSMMIYLAGLQGIPEELHEAASVDGIGPVRRFLRITLPLLSPVILFNGLMAVIGSFQVFTQAFVMTGGEPGNLTRFYVLYLFNQGFEYYEMGYASAMAWLLLLVVLAITVVILRTSARFVYYEALKK
ncbi:MAG: extracellular solute-binding protein [Phycisphaerae bacterium]|nr:extracellular solute-binding protein [Phycisphaerae bacterium]